MPVVVSGGWRGPRSACCWANAAGAGTRTTAAMTVTLNRAVSPCPSLESVTTTVRHYFAFEERKHYGEFLLPRVSTDEHPSRDVGPQATVGANGTITSVSIVQSEGESTRKSDRRRRTRSQRAISKPTST